MALLPEQLAEAAAEAITPILREMKSRIEVLEARLATMEAKALQYAGIYSRGVDYAKGALVTSDGAAWLSTRANIGEKPGAGAGNPWVLVAKGRT